MRPQANGVNLSLSFQSDPGLKQIRCAVTHASSMFLDFDFRNEILTFALGEEDWEILVS
jgi:hypothetical protein